MKNVYNINIIYILQNNTIHLFNHYLPKIETSIPASSFSMCSYTSRPLAKSATIHLIFTLYWLSENAF